MLSGVSSGTQRGESAPDKLKENPAITWLP